MEPEILVNLPIGPDGQERRVRIRLRHGDIARGERVTGVPILSDEAFWTSGLSRHQLSVLLCAGILHQHPNATLGEVQDAITYDNCDEVDTAVAQAVEQYMRPYFERRKKQADAAAERPTEPGMNSGTGSAPMPVSSSD